MHLYLFRWWQAPHSLHPVPYSQFPTPRSLLPVPYTPFPTPRSLHFVLYSYSLLLFPTPFLTPCSLHPARYSLFPTPCSLHPVPYTLSLLLFPTPGSLHLVPYSCSLLHVPYSSSPFPTPSSLHYVPNSILPFSSSSFLPYLWDLFTADKPERPTRFFRGINLAPSRVLLLCDGAGQGHINKIEVTHTPWLWAANQGLSDPLVVVLLVFGGSRARLAVTLVIFPLVLIVLVLDHVLAHWHQAVIQLTWATSGQYRNT